MSEAEKVLIVGGTGTLGAALIEAFQNLKYSVVATRNKRPAETGVQPELWLDVDLKDPGSIERAIQATDQYPGDFKGVIHAAGLTCDQALVKMAEWEWDEVLQINLSSAFHLAKRAWPLLKQSKSKPSHFILVGSMAAKAGHAGQSNYVAAKAGLQGLTQSLSAEWGPDSICVNCVWPGVMPSKMTQNLKGARLEALIRSNSLGRMSSPSETASFIAFLVNQMTQVSGQTFNLDSRSSRWT